MKEVAFAFLIIVIISSCKKESMEEVYGFSTFLEDDFYSTENSTHKKLTGEVRNFDLQSDLVNDILKKGDYNEEILEDLSFTKIRLKDFRMRIGDTPFTAYQFVDSIKISLQGKTIAESYPLEQENIEFKILNTDISLKNSESISTTPETSLQYDINCTWCVVYYQIFFTEDAPSDFEVLMNGSFEYEAQYTIKE